MSRPMRSSAVTGRESLAFEAQRVRFLQKQADEAAEALDRAEEVRDEALLKVHTLEQRVSSAETELRDLQFEHDNVEKQVHASSRELGNLDEHINLLVDRNKDLLEALEQEEAEFRQLNRKFEDLSAEHEDLQEIEQHFARLEEESTHELASLAGETAKFEELLRSAVAETVELQRSDAFLREEGDVDVGELQAALQDVKHKSVKLLQEVTQREAEEQRAQDDLRRLAELLHDLRAQRCQLAVDQTQPQWFAEKVGVDARKEALERTVVDLMQALRSADEANTKLREQFEADQQLLSFIGGADELQRLSGEEQVVLIEKQLRLSREQLQVKKDEFDEKARKVEVLEADHRMLQQELVEESNGRLVADRAARQIVQRRNVVEKKHRMLDGSLQLALEAQAQAEQLLQELHDRAAALATQNEHYAARIDGNEDDKGALSYKLRVLENEERSEVGTSQVLAKRKAELEDALGAAEVERVGVRTEIAFLKEQDMLDESGRVKPILIESECDLVDRLDLNDFLLEAQMSRDAVHLIIDKMSEILEMVHVAQVHADGLLRDLRGSTLLLRGIRDKNRVLEHRTEQYESWKFRVLTRIVVNEFKLSSPSSRGGCGGRRDSTDHVLYLDSLDCSVRELQELHQLIQHHGKKDAIREVRLQDNHLNSSTLHAICQLLELCPYMRRLDLRRNCLAEADIDVLQSFVERLPGVTVVVAGVEVGEIVARSGHQDRLVVSVQDQEPATPTQKAAESSACVSDGDYAAGDAGFMNEATSRAEVASVAVTPTCAESVTARVKFLDDQVVRGDSRTTPSLFGDLALGSSLLKVPASSGVKTKASTTFLSCSGGSSHSSRRSSSTSNGIGLPGLSASSLAIAAKLQPSSTRFEAEVEEGSAKEQVKHLLKTVDERVGVPSSPAVPRQSCREKEDLAALSPSDRRKRVLGCIQAANAIASPARSSRRCKEVEASSSSWSSSWSSAAPSAVPVTPGGELPPPMCGDAAETVPSWSWADDASRCAGGLFSSPLSCASSSCAGSTRAPSINAASSMRDTWSPGKPLSCPWTQSPCTTSSSSVGAADGCDAGFGDDDSSGRGASHGGRGGSVSSSGESSLRDSHSNLALPPIVQVSVTAAATAAASPGRRGNSAASRKAA